MSLPVDLHLHTMFSDGVLTPEELVVRCREASVQVIAVTDHDTVAGLPRAAAEARRQGIRLIEGVELSIEYQGQDIHVLGYGVSAGHGAFAAMLGELERAREERLHGMLGRLSGLGLPLTAEEVRSRALGRVIGRPHVAEALLARGWIENYNDAFRYYIGAGCPAYLPNRTLAPENAIAVIRAAGGVPVLAHPGAYADWSAVLDRFVQAGALGIEVHHPRHDPDLAQTMAEEARRRGLIPTGGSDFHGGGRGDASPGTWGVTVEVVERLDEARARLSSC
mgnify:FL=1